jgi:hypothetical protein
MKKVFFSILLALMMMGCATATYQNGDVTLKVSRPIFAALSASATSSQGDTVSINAASSVQLDQLVALAIKGYAQYMSGGLVSPPVAGPTVQSIPAVAVPKPQATPPPAEIVK